MADTIKIALEMDVEERRERHRALLDGIRTHDTFAWCRSFLTSLENIRRRRPLPPTGEPFEAARKALEAKGLAPGASRHTRLL
jgi:trehalose-6-phosphate synthase